MIVDDWERVIDDAHVLSVAAVQFIGGEPTLHPELPRLVRYALGQGLKVEVYTNLVHVTPELWELFSLPGVSLGTSWYSADPDRHADITGRKGSHARTRANISELCGRCGRGRAAISLHGDLSPCVIGRFLVAGNVKDEPVGDILGGARWREIVASIPAQGGCTPSDSDDCDPSREPSGLDVAR